MFKSAVMTCLMCSLLMSCTTVLDSASRLELEKAEAARVQFDKAEFAKVEQQITELERKLAAQILQSCDNNIDALSKKVDKLKSPDKRPKVVNRCSNTSDATQIGDKLILGSIEKVRLTKEKRKFNARIDTGADTSSIGVFKIKRFERDGKKWVRFSLKKADDAPIYEYPIHDTVKIKQSSTINEDRIEVKIDIEMGGVSYKRQLFNLADRSHLDYQILIGRSFLRDIAIVDVGRKNLLRQN